MTDERRNAIIRLLETRDDNLPSPLSRQEFGKSSGFVHKTLAPQVCDVCEGVDSFGCTGCGGRGQVEVFRDRDPYAVTEIVQPYGMTGERHERSRERDAQIARLEHQTAPPKSEKDLIEEANSRPYAWELARSRMYHQFDYRALDTQLERLRDVDNGAYHALHAVYVYGWAEPSTGNEATCARGLTFLDEHLPTPLRSPGSDAKQSGIIVGKLARGAGASARELRDNEIRALAESGELKPEEIAKRCHVSIRTVYTVVNQEAAA